MSLFSGIAADLLKGFEAVKAAIVKAANEAPKVEAVIQGYEPEVVALASLVAPGAGAVVSAANLVLESVVNALVTSGSAAEANFLNAGVDQAAINAAKAVVPVFKAAVAAKK